MTYEELKRYASRCATRWHKVENLLPEPFSITDLANKWFNNNYFLYPICCTLLAYCMENNIDAKEWLSKLDLSNPHIRQSFEEMKKITIHKEHREYHIYLEECLLKPFPKNAGDHNIFEKRVRERKETYREYGILRAFIQKLEEERKCT